MYLSQSYNILFEIVFLSFELFLYSNRKTTDFFLFFNLNNKTLIKSSFKLQMQIFAILPIFKLLGITIRRAMVYSVPCTHLFNDLTMCTNVLITNNNFISLGKLY